MERLKNILALASRIASLACLVLLAALLLQGVKLVRAVRGSTAAVNLKLNQRDGIMDELQQLAGEAKRAASSAADASDRQAGFLVTENRKFLWTMNHINGLLDNLASDLHGVVGDVSTVLVALKGDLDNLQPVIAEGHDTLAQTKQAIADLDARLINDPDIQEALHRLAVVMTHVETVSVNVEGITDDTHKMTTDVANKVHHTLTDPPTLKSRILTALNMAYHVALLKAALGR